MWMVFENMDGYDWVDGQSGKYQYFGLSDVSLDDDYFKQHDVCLCLLSLSSLIHQFTQPYMK